MKASICSSRRVSVSVSIRKTDIINSQHFKRRALGMYEISNRGHVWDIPNMAKAPKKKIEAQSRALDLAARLEQVKPDGLTERQWCIKAQVSGSFFSNMRGTPTKPPSEPSVGNLRLILETAGTSLPEFFVAEARGRLAKVPTARELERAFADALPELPRAADRRAQYLAEVVAQTLGLPEGLRDEPGNDETPAADDRATDAPLRTATTRV